MSKDFKRRMFVKEVAHRTKKWRCTTFTQLSSKECDLDYYHSYVFPILV